MTRSSLRFLRLVAKYNGDLALAHHAWIGRENGAYGSPESAMHCVCFARWGHPNTRVRPA